MIDSFFDLTQYTGSRTGEKSFTATLDAGAKEMPEGLETIAAIRDQAGNLAVVTLTRSGTSFTVEKLLSESYPSFSGAVTIRGVAGASYLNRSYGAGALLVFAQSNGNGWAGPRVEEIDYVDSRVMQNRYQSRNFSGDLYDTTLDGSVLAVDPLYSYQQNPLDSISAVPHAAKALVNNAGWNAIEIQDGSQGTTAFGPITSGNNQPGGQWVPNGTHAMRLKAMTSEFINRRKGNRAAAMIFALGESDALEGNVTQAQFAAWVDEAIDDQRANVGDPNMPVIMCTMADAFVNSALYSVRAAPIQAAILDTPNRKPFTAVLNTAGLPNQDVFHHNADALRTIGRDLFLPAYYAALTNFSAEASNTLSGTITVTTLMNGSLAASPNLSGSVSVTSSMTGSMDNASTPITGDVSITSSLSGSIAEPILVDALFVRNVGQGTAGQWDDQSGNDNHAIQASASRRPTIAAGGEFDLNGSQNFDLPATLTNNINIGCAIIIDMQTSATGGVVFGGTNTFINTNNPIFVRGMNTSNSFSGSGTLADGTRHVVAMSIDIQAETLRVWIDDTLEIDETEIVAGLTDSILHLGSGRLTGPTFEMTGKIYNAAFVRGPLTKAQIDSIVSNTFGA